MAKSILLTFIEHAEHFCLAQNEHNLQLNICILDLNPFFKWCLRPNHLLDIDKLILLKKSLLFIEKQKITPMF